MGLVHSEVDDGVAVLTLDRPDRLNALSAALADALHDAVGTVRRDASVRALVITGAGGRFSAGADLRDIAGLADGAAFGRFVGHLTRAFAAIEALPVPSIAAVSGIALGGGFELALSCDLRVADEGTRFGLPEIGLDLLPGAGGTQRLFRTVAPAVATELLLFPCGLDAVRARELGLVNRVTPAGGALAEAMTMARELARRSPEALAAAKRLAAVARSGTPLATGIGVERALVAGLFDTPAARAGVARFVART